MIIQLNVIMKIDSGYLTQQFETINKWIVNTIVIRKVVHAINFYPCACSYIKELWVKSYPDRIRAKLYQM